MATDDRRGKPAPPGTTAELAQPFNLAVTEDALEASEDVWNDLGSISVFARMSRNGKAKVIRILKEHDGVVLMCGDGGNDAGALKQSEVGFALFVQSVGKMLNERQLDIAKRAKDVQKLRAQFIKDKQKEFQQEQMAWLQEEVDKRSDKGEIGVMAHVGAVKASLARYATEFSIATREFDKQNGNVYDKVDASPEAQMEKALAATPGQGFARPGDASVAAPFTSKTPSVKGCVDLLRQGRCTLLSSLQVQQVMDDEQRARTRDVPRRSRPRLDIASSCPEERASSDGGKLRFAAQRARAGGDIERHSPPSAFVLPHSG